MGETNDGRCIGKRRMHWHACPYGKTREGKTFCKKCKRFINILTKKCQLCRRRATHVLVCRDSDFAGEPLAFYCLEHKADVCNRLMIGR